MAALENKRILVTRTRQQASDLAARLEALGATALLVPTIEIVPPETYAGLDAALAQLESYDWLLFTSANAVEVFGQRRNPSLIPGRIAVIGPATAQAAREIGLQVDLIPSRYVAESLAEALAPEALGCRILLVRATDARDTLPEMLAAAGAEVTVAEAYRNRVPLDSVLTLRQLFQVPANYPDAITFTSASTARNLVALLEAASLTLPAGIIFVSIGPITSRALRDLGYPPHLEAAEPTIPALVESLAGYFT